MNTNKIYIIGGILLLIGMSIGWFLKPGSTHDSAKMNHHHEESTPQNNDDEIWTCSMHPQIRQNEPSLCPICEMDLIPLDNSMGNDDPTLLRMTSEAVKLAQIETFIVGAGKSNESGFDEDSNPFINADGTVKLDERTVKSQTAHLSGRIDEMTVTFAGQYVSAGQKIATLYSTDLMAASQELITASQYDDRVEGLKNAAKQKLKNWKLTDEQIQRILNNGVPIETIDIYADHSGYVLEKKRSQGDYVRLGEALYTLGSTGRLWLVFDVFESDLSVVEKGNQITFTTPAIPNEIFNAKVSYIDPLLNANTRTATVRAEITNRNNSLKPGMLLQGKIEASKILAKNAAGNLIVIPNSAILWTGDRSVVYVQLPDQEVPTYEFREVVVTNRGYESSVIASGVEIGDEVVTHGAFAVDAAAQLNNNFSMMNREVSVKKEQVAGRVPSFVQSTPTIFRQQLDNAILNYLDIKNALVRTDADEASLSADFFLQSLENIDMTLLTEDAHRHWMEQLNALKSHGENIKNSLKVEKQRDQFDYLSQTMINVVKAFGTHERTYYIQYCPMAKDDQGADWISAEKEIKNPYFGDRMMKCGSLKLELN